MSAPRTILQALKSSGLPYYATIEEYWRQSPNLTGVIPQGPTLGRKKLWADTTAMRQVQDAVPASPSFWGSLMAAPSLGQIEYTVLARDAGGRLLLTPVESAPAYATYSQSVFAVFRERQHFFTAGVPYLVKMKVPVEVAAALNFEGAEPAWDVPVSIAANQLLVPDGRGDALVYDYQDFMKASDVPTDWSDERRLQEVDRVRASGSPSAVQISAIRDLMTYRGGKVVLT